MEPKTLKALQLSIAHWERLASGKRELDEDIGPDYCALCGLFNTLEMPVIDICIGCPVYNHTGQTACEGSPFVAAYRIAEDCELDSPAFLAAAQVELDFLRSLLPKKAGRV